MIAIFITNIVARWREWRERRRLESAGKVVDFKQWRRTWGRS